MTETETILAVAREDLLARDAQGHTDSLVWDHSQRVARTALQLADLPEMAEHRRDRIALFVAGLYHDAGWIVDHRENRVALGKLLTRPTSDVQREFGAAWMSERLAGHVRGATLAVAASAIRNCNHRDTDQLEAQLVAEAENLDEIGPLAIVRMLRRHRQDADGLTTVIDTWHRQQEYHFWPARIKECFRLDVTRRLAEERLAQLETFMYALTNCHRGDDLAERLAELGASVPAMPTP